MNTLMKLWLILLAAQISACATVWPTESKPVIEKSRNLGFGFKDVVLAEVMKGGFEGVVHHKYLYYRKQRICSPGVYSISPTGNYAICQDAYSHDLFLFCKSDQKMTQFPIQSVGRVASFQWGEDANKVIVQLKEGDQRVYKQFPIDSATGKEDGK